MLATGPTELEWIKIGKEKLTKIKNFGFLDRRLVEDNRLTLNRTFLPFSWSMIMRYDSYQNQIALDCIYFKAKSNDAIFFMTSKVNFIKKIKYEKFSEWEIR